MNAIGNGKPVIYGVFWLAIVAGLWGVIERFGMSAAQSYHFAQIVAMRYSIHILALLIICLLLGKKRVLSTQQLGAQLGRGLCMFVMPVSFMFGDSGQIGANLWSAFWLMPVFILMMVSLRDRVGLVTWITTLAAFAGALMVLRPSFGELSYSTFLPAIGGMSFAVYVLLSRKLRNEKPVTSLIYTAIVPLLLMAPVAIFVWAPIQSEEFWKVAGIGIFGLLSLYSIDRTTGLLSPAFIAPLFYFAVISEPLIEFLRSDGIPAMSQLAGALLLLIIGSSFVLKKLMSGERLG